MKFSAQRIWPGPGIDYLPIHRFDEPGIAILRNHDPQSFGNLMTEIIDGAMARADILGQLLLPVLPFYIQGPGHRCHLVIVAQDYTRQNRADNHP